MTTSSPDSHTSTGAYAADALAPEEREEVERHLAVCPTCAQEVAEMRAALPRLAEAGADPPPPALRARVLAQVGRTRQLPPIPVGSGRRGRGRWWTGTPLQVVAAAFLVVAVALSVLLAHRQQQLDDQRHLVAEITSVLNDPN